MRKILIIIGLPLFLLLLVFGINVNSATILADEVVEIYRGSMLGYGDYSYSGDSVDQNGNKLFHFNIKILPFVVQHIHETDNDISFNVVQYIFETNDYRLKSECNFQDVQSGKITWMQYRKCLLNEKKNNKDPRNKEVFTQELLPLEVVEKVVELGEIPLVPIIEKENLRISASYIGGERGLKSKSYSKLRMRIVIELIN